MNWGNKEEEHPGRQNNESGYKKNSGNNPNARGNDSDSDEIEDSDNSQVQAATTKKIKYSDVLYKMVGKIIYKEVNLESKRKDYDMFIYQISTSGNKEKEKAYVLSRTELKKSEVPVDGKPIKVYDKLIYMSKTG